MIPVSVTEIVTGTSTPPTLPFEWRSRDGVFNPVNIMSTHHLWFTVRMAWNHTMPVAARSAEYKKYHFAPFYTAAYMREAIRAILRELAKRTDMEPDWLDEMAFFADYLRKVEPDLKAIAAAGSA